MRFDAFQLACFVEKLKILQFNNICLGLLLIIDKETNNNQALSENKVKWRGKATVN